MFFICFILFLTYLHGAGSVYVEAMVGNSISTAQGFKPQIAMKCGYYNQYFDRTGVWLSDSRGNCLTEPKDILEYCRSAYPDLNITNVMESGSATLIENWCQPNEVKCDKAFGIAPYRCLEGNFQSEALLVPEGCVFDHVHSGKSCLTHEYWTLKAEQACHQRSSPDGSSFKTKRMTVVSSSMLLPCQVGRFSGVEFVCCPPVTTEPPKQQPIDEYTTAATTDQDFSNTYSQAIPEQVKDIIYSSITTTNAEGMNQSIQSIFQSSTTPNIPKFMKSVAGYKMTNQSPSPIASQSTTGQEQRGDEKDGHKNEKSDFVDISTKLKSYLDLFDKEHEHEAFVQAKKALRDKRRGNIIRIMEEWGMSEHRYQKLKETDPLAAEQFKKDITNRFQKTITALEEEETAQKKQLIAVHEQRVTSLLNEKKREYMFDFLRELERSHPVTNAVRDTLQKLLRTEEKDKMHVIHYYEHLLNTDAVAASKVKSMVAQHVTEIEHRMNRSVKMLAKRLPEIHRQIYPQIKDYLDSIKTRNGDFDELTKSITRGQRPTLDTTFKVHATADTLPSLKVISPPTSLGNEVAKNIVVHNGTLDDVEDQNEDDDVTDDDDDDDDEDYDDDDDDVTERPTVRPGPVMSQFHPYEESDHLASSPHVNSLFRKKDLRPSPYAAKKMDDSMMVDVLQHHQGGNSESNAKVNTRTFALASTVSIIAVASFALIIIGLVLVRRKMHFNHPHNQHQPLPTHPNRKEGDNISNFVEVDNQSLEERHLANMQVNGYENPTYRYFEKIVPKA